MEIDPFTVVAQLLNFVVLVALLRRFLYAPVLRAMQEREARISARLTEAAGARASAESEAERLRAANLALDAAREELLAEARTQAEKRRRELVELAREDVRRQRERWREALEREKQATLDELERRILEEVYAIARRALADLADLDLEHSIARSFLRRLEKLEPETWKQALEACEEGSPPAFVLTSAFPLPADSQSALVDSIRKHAGANAELRFAVHPETLAGVELETAGLRIAWSLEEFLRSLEDLLPAPERVPAVETAR